MEACGPNRPEQGSLTSPSAVPLIVVTRSEERAELINSSLRNEGVPVRVSRLDDTGDLAAELEKAAWDMVVVFADEAEKLLHVAARVLGEHLSPVLLIACRESLDEAQIAADLDVGANDSVSLAHRDRLTRVLLRELRAGRLSRSLRDAASSASDYKEQLQSFMAGVTDAIAHVSEGILVDANKAWLDLFGYPDAAELVGLPFMDVFATDHHAALKGALVAVSRNQWSGDRLRVDGLSPDGEALGVELNLEPGSFDGEPAIRISIAPSPKDDTAVLEELQAARLRDPATGVYTRHHLLDLLQQRLTEPMAAGIRSLAVIRPDGFSNMEKTIGLAGTEEILVRLASRIRDLAQPRDLYGRLGGNAFAVVLERGGRRDVKAWAENFIEQVSKEPFDVAGKSIAVTCTVGIAIAADLKADGEELIREATGSCWAGAELGGHRISMPADEAESTLQEEVDQVWKLRIKQALMENRFRLAHQPIASLTGSDEGLFDILVRMLDEQGEEVLPSEFLPAAVRTRLVKNIDRWVIGAAFSFCAARKPQRIFVRLSKDTILDKMLTQWLGRRAQDASLKPQQVVFQISEKVASAHMRPAQELSQELKKLGFGFCVDSLGSGSSTLQVIEQVPMHYAKIDGALMQGLAGNDDRQEQVGAIVESANSRSVATIAERVEDANTMAVLWQLGVAFIQGYQVREPEVVLSDDDHHG